MRHTNTRQELTVYPSFPRKKKKKKTFVTQQKQGEQITEILSLSLPSLLISGMTKLRRRTTEKNKKINKKYIK